MFLDSLPRNHVTTGKQCFSAFLHLRLDLLRLRAGVGHPDDLTLAIEEARSVRRAVELELSAMAEVRAMVFAAP